MIVVDHVEYGLEFVKNFVQCEVINFKEVGDMAIHIKRMTAWLGAGVCIDAVGCEAAGNALDKGIRGWGADLDPANRPAVPMERTPPRLYNVHLDEPAPQSRRVTVFHSNEQPGMTPVFGSSVPPSRLSAKMRALAFRYSENDIRHWLILLAADRVNVGEGVLEDLAHGHGPNVFRETGMASEWRRWPCTCCGAAATADC